jgi:hypothetical protein
MVRTSSEPVHSSSGENRRRTTLVTYHVSCKLQLQVRVCDSDLIRLGYDIRVFTYDPFILEEDYAHLVLQHVQHVTLSF